MSNLAVIVKPFGGLVENDNRTHTNRFTVPNSTGARRYMIAQSISTGEWQCSCPGWVFKKEAKDRSCKHLKAMRPVLQKISRIG